MGRVWWDWFVNARNRYRQLKTQLNNIKDDCNTWKDFSSLMFSIFCFSCLSPRSAYFYEFPPNERASKKKTTFSRFLKTLKSSKHKDKNSNSSNQTNHNSPKHSTVNSRVSTSSLYVYLLPYLSSLFRMYELTNEQNMADTCHLYLLETLIN